MSQNVRVRKDLAAASAARFNERFPMGTPVRVRRGAREGGCVETRTRSPAQVLGGHTAVVWVDGMADCIALTHVEVIRS